MRMLLWPWSGVSRTCGRRYRVGRRSAGMPVSEQALRLAAEVLEPRCLLTDTVGVDFTRSGQTVVVPASQWDDDGLTVIVEHDAFLLGHTGQDLTEFSSIPFESVSRLLFKGRNQAADALNVEFFSAPDVHTPRIDFDGGTGSQTDLLSLGGYYKSASRFEPTANRSGLVLLAQSKDAVESGVGVWTLSYHDIELVHSDVGDEHQVVQFGPENNLVTISPCDEHNITRLTDAATGAVIESTRPWIEVFGGAGNDRVTAAIDAPIGILNGEAGNDTLIAGDWGGELHGGDGADSLVGCRSYGDAGNDTLDGGTEWDELHGGSGNDLIRGGSGTDTLFGEAGNDTLEGGDAEDNLYGGDGNDVLRGGDGDDTLAGEVGNDSLDGDAGSDMLYGAGAPEDRGRASVSSVSGPDDFGRDTLRGGSGDDYLVGDAGNDSLFGDSGNDQLHGGLGNDKLDGGDDDDALDGEEGNDSLFGGNGRDDLYEYFGSNLMDGGAGNDNLAIGWIDDSIPVEPNTLLGQAGNDTLFGGMGNDLVSGGDGRDSINGDFGNDTLRGDAGNDTIDGGEGNDLLDGGSERDRLNDDSEHGNNTLLGGGGNDSLTVSGDGNNVLDGGAGHDRLEGGNGPDKLSGGDGNDLLIGGDGADRLDGGAGRDKLVGKWENPDFGIDPGDQLLNGELTADESWDDEYSDIDLDAEATTETIITAADWTDGGLTVWWNNYGLTVERTDTGEVLFQTWDRSSVDRWVIQGRDNAADLLTVSVTLPAVYDYSYSYQLPAILFDGGGGADELRLQADAQWLQFDPRRDRSGWVYVEGDDRSPDNDQPMISYRNVELVQDDASADGKILQFGSENNDVDFVRVPDTEFVEVTDRATGNVIRLSDARRYTSVLLGAGNDRLAIRDSNTPFYVDGEAGNDTLLLESFRESCTLNGGDGDDSLQGNAGRDELYGDGGNDTLNGMGGTDVLEGWDGNDLLLGGDDNDELSGSAGNDTLLGEGAQDNLNGDEGDDLLNGGNGDDQIDGGLGDDTLQGGRGNDVLIGNDGANRMEGGNGDDLIMVSDYRNKNDPDQFWPNTLLGEAGHDTLWGGRGNDSLSGGDGQDVLDGRAGNDTLRGDANPDQLDGGDGNDLLDGGDARDILNDSNGDDTLLGGAANDWLGDCAGNNLLDGGSGHDELHAGDGRDTLRGGVGNDWLEGGDNADSLDGGAGQDLLSGNYGSENDPGDRMLNGELHDFTFDGWPAAQTDIDWDMEITTVTLVTAADWSDAGLTLSYFYDDNGWLFHVQRTDTGQDVIEPFRSSSFDRYVIEGRDFHDDVLTVDISDSTAELQGIVFAGGLGDSDELRLVGDEGTTLSTMTFQPLAGDSGSVRWDGDRNTFSNGVTPSLKYSDVEAIVCSTPADTTTIHFGDEANNIVLDGRSPDGLWRLSDLTTHTSMRLRPPSGAETLVVQAGGGDDRVTLRPSAVIDSDDHIVSVLGEAGDDTLTGHIGLTTLLLGGDGNDLLIGSGSIDELHGESGNDTLQGLGDDDWLYGEGGDDLLLGGDGNDTLIDDLPGDDTLKGEQGHDTITSDDDHDQLAEDAEPAADIPNLQRAKVHSRPVADNVPAKSLTQAIPNAIAENGPVPGFSRELEFVNNRPEFRVLASSWPNATAKNELTESITATSQSTTSMADVFDCEPLDPTEPYAASTLLETLDPADIDRLLSDADLLGSLM